MKYISVQKIMRYMSTQRLMYHVAFTSNFE